MYLLLRSRAQAENARASALEVACRPATAPATRRSGGASPVRAVDPLGKDMPASFPGAVSSSILHAGLAAGEVPHGAAAEPSARPRRTITVRLLRAQRRKSDCRAGARAARQLLTIEYQCGCLDARVLAGLGIDIQAEFLVWRETADGRLEEVLPKCGSTRLHLSS